MKRLKQIVARGRDFVNHHRLASLIIAGAFGVFTVLNVAMLLTGDPLPRPIQDIAIAKKPEPKYYSPLTGLQVKKESDAAKPVTAIMIENSPDARPQSGLKQAELVFEANAEGGITRFLALYQQNKPSLVGPVRSVRPYYVDWLIPYNASVAHVGGNPPAIKKLRDNKQRDIDQYYNEGTYWRASDRFAPHNVYTNFKRIDKLNKQKGYKTSKPKAFERADTKPATKPNARSISVKISSDLFNSSYSYDKKHDNYVRSQAGAPHKDREKGTITPKVVIVMTVKEQTIVQDTAREQITTTGSGKVVIFQNGQAIKATWKRSNIKNAYQFVDSKGKQIPLARGQTWITAIPSGKGSVSWKK